MIGEILLEIAKPALAALGVLLLGVVVKWFKKHNKNYKETPEEKSERELKEFLIFKYKIYKCLKELFPDLDIQFKGKTKSTQNNEFDIYISDLNMAIEILSYKYSPIFRDYYLKTDSHEDIYQKASSARSYAKTSGISGFEFYLAGMEWANIDSSLFELVYNIPFRICVPRADMTNKRLEIQDTLLGIYDDIKIHPLLSKEILERAENYMDDNYSKVLNSFKYELTIMDHIKLWWFKYDAISVYVKNKKI